MWHVRAQYDPARTVATAAAYTASAHTPTAADASAAHTPTAAHTHTLAVATPRSFGWLQL